MCVSEIRFDHVTPPLKCSYPSFLALPRPRGNKTANSVLRFSLSRGLKTSDMLFPLPCPAKDHRGRYTSLSAHGAGVRGGKFKVRRGGVRVRLGVGSGGGEGEMR